MSWNYRVVKVHNGEHVICEVYYNGDDSSAVKNWSVAVPPAGWRP